MQSAAAWTTCVHFICLYVCLWSSSCLCLSLSVSLPLSFPASFIPSFPPPFTLSLSLDWKVLDFLSGLWKCKMEINLSACYSFAVVHQWVWCKISSSTVVIDFFHPHRYLLHDSYTLRERETDRQRERETETERMCVSVCTCMCVYNVCVCVSVCVV